MDGRLSSDEQIELDSMMQARLDEVAALDGAVFGRLQQKVTEQHVQLVLGQVGSEESAVLIHQQTQLIADALSSNREQCMIAI